MFPNSDSDDLRIDSGRIVDNHRDGPSRFSVPHLEVHTNRKRNPATDSLYHESSQRSLGFRHDHRVGYSIK